jgi:dUTP pyrophosphatase
MDRLLGFSGGFQGRSPRELPAMLTAKVCVVRPGVQMPAFQTPDSVGFDLVSAEDVSVGPGAIVAVPTGLVIEPPEGFHLVIAARSSLSSKKGLILANGIGVVDPDYCGPDDELLLALWNPSSIAVVDIRKGERLCQAFFRQFPRVELRQVSREALGGTSRGGLGSTGGYSQA